MCGGWWATRILEVGPWEGAERQVKGRWSWDLRPLATGHQQQPLEQ